MTNESRTHVDAEVLTGAVASLFEATGMTPGNSRLMGVCLVDADLRGHHSHGVRWAARYLDWLRTGYVDARAEPGIVGDRGGAVLVDANKGAGPVATTYAMEVAVERAKSHGSCVVTVRRNSHCGAMGFYTQRAADEGCIGFAATRGGMRMAPWGGVQPRIGANAMSWAAPTARGFAFNLDMSPTVAAGSRIEQARLLGNRIPLGWGFDANGDPTDDPEVVAGVGTLAPMGGHKGVGLALAASVLSAVLSGSQYGERETKPDSSQIVQAIDIEAFQPMSEFLARMDRMIDGLKTSKRKAGAGEILIPGERAHLRRQDYTRAGIPLDGATRALLRRAAESVDMTIELGD